MTTRPRARLVGLLLLATLSSSSGFPGAGVAAAPGGDPVLVGAGDIAGCEYNEDEATAKLLDSIDGTVFTVGDNVYSSGTASQFKNCYDPTWGRHKERTRPTPGNHEYRTDGAAAYFDYFGAAAGKRGEGYYSYNLGAWHIIALNSNISIADGSAQEQWLQADLEANPADCTLAYWHHPRFSSGEHGSSTTPKAIWETLYEAGADVVLNGHDHNYERFAPQDPDGTADAAGGIRQFIVGMGGKDLRSVGKPIANSEVRNATTHGVLKLTLHATSYDWEFVPVAGQKFTDSGSASCVLSGTPEPPAPPEPPAYPEPPVTPPGPPTIPPGTSDNLLRNADFESDQNKNGRPDVWTSNRRATRSDALVRSGSYALQLKARGERLTMYQSVRRVSPGQRYAISGWVNIPVPSDRINFQLQLSWRNAGNDIISTETIQTYTAPTGGWKEATAKLVAPPGTAKATVRFVDRSSRDVAIYVDDLVLRSE